MAIPHGLSETLFAHCTSKTQHPDKMKASMGARQSTQAPDKTASICVAEYFLELARREEKQTALCHLCFVLCCLLSEQAFPLFTLCATYHYPSRVRKDTRTTICPSRTMQTPRLGEHDPRTWVGEERTQQEKKTVNPNTAAFWSSRIGGRTADERRSPKFFF